jgi:hypothetical protein
MFPNGDDINFFGPQLPKIPWNDFQEPISSRLNRFICGYNFNNRFSGCASELHERRKKTTGKNKKNFGIRRLYFMGVNLSFA